MDTVTAQRVVGQSRRLALHILRLRLAVEPRITGERIDRIRERRVQRVWKGLPPVETIDLEHRCAELALAQKESLLLQSATESHSDSEYQKIKGALTHSRSTLLVLAFCFLET